MSGIFDPGIFDSGIFDESTSGVVVIPGVAGLALTASIPTVAAPRTVLPGAAGLTLTTSAPVVLAGRNPQPGAASLTLTSSVPAVTVTANVTVTPGAASLTLTASAPSVSTPQTALPTAASLTLTSSAPSVEVSASIQPGAASLSLAASAPSVTVTSNIVAIPGAASLTLTASSPAVAAPRTVLPGTVSLTVTTAAPSVAVGTSVQPGAASLTTTTSIPAVTTGGPSVFPDPASLVISGYTVPVGLLGPLLNPDGSGGSVGTPHYASIVSITVGGVDITDDVIFNEANFTSQANGVAGSCSIKVRDNDRTRSFTTGAIINLDINGQRVWTGYLTRSRRAYAFPAYATLERFFVLEGDDINVLFTKRILHRASNGAKVPGPTYGAHTADTTVLADLLTSTWLDVGGDSLDLSSLVENVADVNYNQPWNGWNGGMQWGEAMQVVARLPAALFYLDPDRRLVYTDVDTPNAPYGLSDMPGAGEVGYRNFELLNDGNNLANDVLVWGAGTGPSQEIVFSRAQSAASQAAHGLWQWGDFTFDVYKQGTADKIADSVLNGSKSSKRGHKNDRVAIVCETSQSGFRVAQKVSVTSNAYGYSDVLPIRAMTVTFVTKYDPWYRLTISHEIDAPWSFAEFWNPRVTGSVPQIPPIIPPPPPPTPGGCDDCTSTIDDYDDFNRSEGGQWGGAWITWANDNNDGFTNLISVDGDYGHLQGRGQYTLTMQDGGDGTDQWNHDSFTVTIRFAMFSQNTNGTASFAFARPDNSASVYVVIQADSTAFGTDNDVVSLPFTLDLTGGTDYYLKWEVRGSDGLSDRFKVWAVGDTEPSSWLHDSGMPTILVSEALNFRVASQNVPHDAAYHVLYVNDISFTYDRCVGFHGGVDNFDGRTTAVFGANVDINPASSGYSWDTGGGSEYSCGVTTGYFRCYSPNLGSFGFYAQYGRALGAPYLITALSTATVLQAKFRTSFVPSGADNNATTYGDIQLELEWSTTYGDIDLQMVINNSTYNGASAAPLGSVAVNFGTSVLKSDWVANSWYNVKLEVSGAPGSETVGVKLWLDGSAEPGSYIVSNDATWADPSGSADGRVQYTATFDPGNNATWSDEYVDLDYIDADYDGRTCYDGGSPPSPDGTTSTTAGGQLSGNGLTTGGSAIDVGSPYLAGSLELWVEGTYQIPGVDFAEDSPTLGTAHWINVPAAGLLLSVKFIAVSYGGGGYARRVL